MMMSFFCCADVWFLQVYDSHYYRNQLSELSEFSDFQKLSIFLWLDIWFVIRSHFYSDKFEAEQADVDSAHAVLEVNEVLLFEN